MLLGSTGDAFVWRSATAPGRVRVIGAAAMAASFICLGFVAGRWSTHVIPTAEPDRTAALIEAVAKETRAPSVPKSDDQHLRQGTDISAEIEKKADAPLPAPAPLNRNAESDIRASAPPSKDDSTASQDDSSASKDESSAREVPERRAEPVKRHAERRAAPTDEAPDYQALREYMLSR
jgi:hypothetical protein